MHNTGKMRNFLVTNYIHKKHPLCVELGKIFPQITVRIRGRFPKIPICGQSNSFFSNPKSVTKNGTYSYVRNSSTCGNKHTGGNFSLKE